MLAVIPEALFDAAEDGKSAWITRHVEMLDVAAPWLRVTAALLPVFLIPGALAMEWLRDWARNPDSLEEEELATLIRCFETPVGSKRSKLGSLLRSVVKENLPCTPQMIWSAASPLEQIGKLVEGIHIAFASEVEKPDEIKVTLARMKDGYIEDFEFYLPLKQGPSTPIEDLQSQDSTFSVAAKKKEMIILPDVAKEAKKGRRVRRYIPGPNGSAEGSIVCYPVVHRELGIVPFVIGVKYPEKRAFTAMKKRRYEYILSQFSERICLEYSLQRLRNNTQP